MATTGRKIKVSPCTTDAQPMCKTDVGRQRVTDEQLAKMLVAADGFRSRVAKQLGLSVSAISMRIARSRRLQEACHNVDETILDLAESALVKAAQNGEPWAVCFILKCKGRKRGWIERRDVAIEAETDKPPLVLGMIPIARERKDASGEVIDVQ